jgi:hypothetical protein
MRRLASVFALTLAAVLGGCAITGAIVVTDKYTGAQRVQSYLPVLHSNLVSVTSGRLIYSNNSVFLDVKYNSDADWAFFRSATAMGGERLEVRQVDRRASGRSVIEEVRIVLSPELIKQAAESKLEIRLEGQRGYIELVLQGEVPQKFVAKVKEAFPNSGL